MKMSERQYEALLNKKGQGKLTKDKKGAVSASERLTRMVRELNAIPAGQMIVSKNQVRVSFSGIRLASLNILLVAGRFANWRYATAWHKLIARTSLNYRAKTGQSPPYYPQASMCITQVVAHHPMDLDNIVAKAATDGLRKAGIFPDDDPYTLISHAVSQEVGQQDCIVLVINQEPVGQPSQDATKD